MTQSHQLHRGINGRGYRMSGCPECELRWRMAWRDVDPPDSAWENALWCAASVGLLLFIYAMSGAPLAWPA